MRLLLEKLLDILEAVTAFPPPEKRQGRKGLASWKKAWHTCKKKGMKRNDVKNIERAVCT